MFSYEPVHMAAEAVKPAVGKRHNGFRRFKDLSGSDLKFKPVGIDAGHKPGLAKRADLCGFVMISAVDQIKSVDITMIFVCVCGVKHDKGIGPVG